MSDSDPPPSSELTERPMPMFVAAGWALGATLAFLLLASLMISVSPAAADDLISQVACQAGAYLLAIYFILRVHAPTADAGSFLAFRRTNVAFYALAILLGAALVLPADALFNAITHRFPLPEFDDPTIGIFQSASLPRKLVMVGVACVAGPFLEELLFRGALFKPLRKSFLGLAMPTIVTTALLFALVHMKWQRMVHIGLIGLGLGFIRKSSGSIIPSTLVHVTYNATAFVAAVLLTVPGSPEVDIPTPLWGVAASTAIAIGLLGLVHLVGKHSETARRAQELDQA
jgi:uncharacterized protein